MLRFDGAVLRKENYRIEYCRSLSSIGSRSMKHELTSRLIKINQSKQTKT